MNPDDLWYKNAVFYEVYLRAFRDSNADGNGDLNGLIEKLDYLQELGVDSLWLMPIYPSPLLDAGYDIADYKAIDPDFGNLKDFKDLVDSAHRHGIRLILDLVLNHTSDQHPWFQSARQNRLSPYRDYYVWSDDDQKYGDTRIIFVDVEKSNWTWDEAAGQYYWHRFYSSQPDLNYDNLAVQQEILDVVKFWLDLGVDGFRADAVPYLFEREGTSCENLPQTHAFLKKLRRFIDDSYPGRILLCEANQWPREVRSYFGEGDEFHLGFNFPLMPRIFMAIRKGDISPLLWVLGQTPLIPDACQWCTFLRNHDELTLEMVSPEERQWMWEEYSPKPRMRLNLGIRRRLAPLLDNDLTRVKLAYSVLFTLPGSPILYYGDEIGMGDDIWLPDRKGVRTPMQWNPHPGAGFSEADPQLFYSPLIHRGQFGYRKVNVLSQQTDPNSLYNWIRNTLRLRKSHPAFGMGDLQILPSGTPAVLAHLRRVEGDNLLILNNFSAQMQRISLKATHLSGNTILDLFSHEVLAFPGEGECRFELSPHGFRWYKINSRRAIT
jgi:maltose alpha-D-glucosyltransferase/alpha-amylase